METKNLSVFDLEEVCRDKIILAAEPLTDGKGVVFYLLATDGTEQETELVITADSKIQAEATQL